MSNQAAWLSAAKAYPFKIDDTPMPKPDANEVIVRNYAVAINPVDAKIQVVGMIVQNYPTILGLDGAGEVVEVGSAVTKFKKGDRVVACFNGIDYGKIANCAFQLYAGALETLVCKIPDNITYAEASVLPLGFWTATAGLFEKRTLALPYPKIGAKPLGKVLLIWGGSSSVGSCAIQLAKGVGLEVATTASARNLDYCKSIGADYVFDHAKPDVENDILTALKGKEFAGAFDCISMPPEMNPSVKTWDELPIVICGRVAEQLGGTKFVSTVLPTGMSVPDGVLPDGVGSAAIYGTSPARNEIGPVVWGEWMPAALEDGSLKCKPDPLIVGKGLDKIQEACDKMMKGVSATKLVVEL